MTKLDVKKSTMVDSGKRVVISLDAMGGDHAPRSVIAAAAAYYKRNPNTSFIFTGDEVAIKSELKKVDLPVAYYHVVHTKTVVGNDEAPVKALRSGRESSMRKAVDLVKEGAADACLSAGNTGALMVMSKFVLGDLDPHLKRPAITSVFPNKHGEGAVLLDVGANAECDGATLTQFAFMGVAFANSVLNINKPRVGLLNIGGEAGKGRDVDKKTYEILSALDLNFIGNVEPMDIVEGKVDVVVTDGFTGNITIKVAEAASSICVDAIKNAINQNLFTKTLGFLLKKHLKRSFAVIDHRKYNGAMFVGVNGIVVKSHGSSDEVAYENAIDVCYNLIKRGVNQQIITMLDQGDNVNSSNQGIFHKIKESSAKILGIK